MQVPLPHATSSRKSATTSVCCSTTVKGYSLENTSQLSVFEPYPCTNGEIRSTCATACLYVRITKDTYDKKIEMNIAKVRLEALHGYGIKDPKFLPPSPHLDSYLLHRFASKVRSNRWTLFSFSCRKKLLSVHDVLRNAHRHGDAPKM